MADLGGVNGQRKDFKVVGKPNLPGRLSQAIASGIAKFGIDYAVPDMLHAKFLRSPYANAKVVSVDATKARAIPGVVDVITWEDEDIKNLSSGGGFMGPAQPFLDNIADQEGVEVAVIVVAETEDICEEALRQLDVKWEVLPHVVDLHEGRKPDAPVIRPASAQSKGGVRFGMGGGNNPPKKGNVSYSNVSEGDVEAGFREADHIIEFDVNTAAFAGHLPNPPGSIAWWFDSPYYGDGKNLRIEGNPWGHDQVVGMYRLPAEGLSRGHVRRRQVLRLGRAQIPADHAAAGQKGRPAGPVRQ
jgi:CO/xanthine dehydrogenase Mo-binding subunit